ncbi:MAG TPA: type III pantothenate kinase [Anaerolineaceae bacterium]|nr:type III pantothenate kinase [Anaerolineaceae bacterium]
MLLCIDIGNTNIKFGLFAGEEIRYHWRIATDRTRLADEYAMLLFNLFDSAGIKPGEMTGCAISSVVPVLTQVFEEMVARYFTCEPLILNLSIDTGVQVRTDYPEEVGADLIANAVGAKALYGTPAIVVGFGTATTFSAISNEGNFEGVAIAPGVITSSESLFRAAAALPQIALQRPPVAVGKNTIRSLQAGIVFGFAALVEGLVERIQAELGGNAHVVATGGLAHLISGETRVIQHVEPNLTLIGLRLIYERNRSRGC